MVTRRFPRQLAAGLVALAALSATVAPGAGAAERIDGGDNVDVAIWLSQDRFESATTVVLGRSDTWPDSLGAGALAGTLDRPLLLNPPDALDPRVHAELERLGPELVRIVGGTAAISNDVEEELESLFYEVVRYAGPNRVSTAVDIAADSQSDGASLFDDSEVVYLARAFGDGTAGFADSLGAGMLAASSASPLLVTATETLSDETRQHLATVDAESVAIIGGTSAVSEAVEAEIRRLGFVVDRLAGVNRFATAEVLGRRLADEADESSFTVFLIDGRHRDAWATGFAAAIHASDGGAIALTDGDAIPAETASLLDHIRSTRDGTSPARLVCAPHIAAATCDAAADRVGS